MNQPALHREPQEDITLVETAALKPGTLVAGKYVVGRFVGAGGMAQVFEAVNQDLDERVALKVMRPNFRADSGFTEKFRAEARAAARIRSENVARVFDVVSTDDGDPVIVMEYLDGEDLRSWTQTNGGPSLEVAAGWVIEACSGLAVAHANGIVHRDVKPENLFLADEIGGRTVVKLLDFGISRAALAHNPMKPGSGQHGNFRLLGTPSYMAPEQITSSRAADCRLDVWSVGVLLFELFAGITPFEKETPEATCMAILNGDRRDLRVLCPTLPIEMVEIIERCLCIKPQGRYPSVADLAVDLHPFARPQDRTSVSRTVRLLRSAGLTEALEPANNNDEPRLSVSGSQPVAAIPSAPAPTASTGPGGSASPSSELPHPGALMTSSPPLTTVSAQPPEKKSRGGLFVGLAAVVLLLGAVGFFALRSKPVESAQAPAPAAATSVAVEVVSEPVGASILIDGMAVGEAPYRAKLQPGKHEVTLSMSGYESSTRIVEARPDIEGTTLKFALRSAGGVAKPELASKTNEQAERESTAPSDSKKKSKSVAAAAAAAAPAPAPAPQQTSAPTAPPTVKLITDGPSAVKVIQ
jgi:serine/threonine protein kinase